MIIGVWVLEFIWLLCLGYWLFPYRVFSYFINADDAGFRGFGKDVDILRVRDYFAGGSITGIRQNPFPGKASRRHLYQQEEFHFLFSFCDLPIA